jgi:peptidoglycan/xylan/chitin deacetylase (PgdA/CDA1 family)
MSKYFVIVAIWAMLLLSIAPIYAQDRPAPIQDKQKKKQMCITFDDLPVVRVHDRIERLMITDEILYTLEEFDVIAAGFVVGANIEDDYDILENSLSMGHTLGGHTFSHTDLNEVPIELYIQNIDKGNEAIEKLLEAAGQTDRYFRHPFLHYGTTFDIREAVINHLDRKGVYVAHVSIDTEDFAFNLQYEKIYRSADSIEIVNLGNEYIDHILERIEDAEELADDLMGRPVKHIILLHLNRLNANFLPDLLTEMSTLGYSFISLEKALSDPVYSIDEMYMGPMGLSYLERLAKTDPDLMPARETR